MTFSRNRFRQTASCRHRDARCWRKQHRRDCVETRVCSRNSRRLNLNIEQIYKARARVTPRRRSDDVGKPRVPRRRWRCLCHRHRQSRTSQSRMPGRRLTWWMTAPERIEGIKEFFFLLKLEFHSILHRFLIATQDSAWIKIKLYCNTYTRERMYLTTFFFTI